MTRKDNVLQLRKQGYIYPEIVRRTGIPYVWVKQVCESTGLSYTDDELKASKCKPMDESEFKRRLELKFPTIEYVGGYTNSGKPFYAKCKKCGIVTTHNASMIRKRNNATRCFNCERIASKQNRANEKSLKEIAKREIKAQQIEFQECELCGNIYVNSKSKKYCSEQCRKKANNRKKDNRLNPNNVIDKDITLEKLFRKENGICYICGEQCDWADHTRNKYGDFIVGGNYPTIEHVIPLCRGGKHSWDNIKLACFKCNTIEGAS